jgi:hypothetical protein
MQLRFVLFVLTLISFPFLASADTPGQAGFKAVRTCVMQNDANYCRSILTPDSLPFFERFNSYKLMPCLPTDFVYSGENAENGHITVKAVSPPVNGNIYTIRLVFQETPQGPKLDLPASFARGLGQNWQDKVNMGEQLYLLMRQNMGDKLTCDQLDGLIKSH